MAQGRCKKEDWCGYVGGVCVYIGAYRCGWAWACACVGVGVGHKVWPVCRRVGPLWVSSTSWSRRKCHAGP